ncbi:hypothetical protein ACFWIB_10990 [Streptomyces sp. NPDC127051]|uniref:hypothetical protein n=1 Tax=Streptomyces sp. NPDC127051 TaxID=3347119 RepID=UPI00364B61AE
MTYPIPAGPGWYLRETDGQAVTLEPIVAWWPATDSDDDPILLPFIPGGPLAPIVLIDADGLTNWGRTIVYDPTHKTSPEEQW